MKNCYNCSTKLLPKELATQENQIHGKYSHFEHLIPNFCGGILTSNELLCSDCGNKFGRTIDTELYFHLHPFCTLLDVKRDRNVNIPILAKSKSGQDYYISADLVPKPKMSKPNVETMEDGKIKFPVIARNTDDLEAKKKLIKIINPGIHLDIQKSNIYIEEPLYLPFQISMDCLKGVCKVALNFYLYQGGNIKIVNHLIEYLENNNSTQRPVHFCYLNNRVIDLEAEEISHFVLVRGNSKNQLLYAYIEFFNVSCFVIVLNPNYLGIDFEYQYCYNLVKQEQITKPVVKLEANEIKFSNESFTPYHKKHFLDRSKRFIEVVSNIRGGLTYHGGSFKE